MEDEEPQPLARPRRSDVGRQKLVEDEKDCVEGMTLSPCAKRAFESGWH